MRAAAASFLLTGWLALACDGGDDGGDTAAGTAGGSESGGDDGCADGQLPCNDECVDPYEPTLANVHGQILMGCLAAACHGDAGPSENLVVTTPEQAHMNLVGVASMQDPARKLVEPGDPGASYLLSKLNGMDMAPQASDGGPSVQMPIGFPPICEARMQLVEDWIAAGAPGP